jgi:murein endopeptidase
MALRVQRLVALLLVSCLVASSAAQAAGARAEAPNCDAHRSTSIGSPGNGRLVNGVLFPATGPDHFAWSFRAQRIGGSDRTRWGHCHVVRAVLRGLAAYRDRNPGAPLVAVGDMALRDSGEIDGHSTHENGRQVDLYLPRRDRKLREPHAVAQVDLRLTRELVRAILNAGAYQILIGPHIQIRTPPRVIRWRGHDDHLHAMF